MRSSFPSPVSEGEETDEERGEGEREGEREEGGGRMLRAGMRDDVFFLLCS